MLKFDVFVVVAGREHNSTARDRTGLASQHTDEIMY